MLRSVVFLDTAVMNAMSSLRISKYSLFLLYPILEVEAYRGPNGILQIRMVPHDLEMIIEIKSIEATHQLVNNNSCITIQWRSFDRMVPHDSIKPDTTQRSFGNSPSL
jgi:hypothetical protein